MYMLMKICLAACLLSMLFIYEAFSAENASKDLHQEKLKYISPLSVGKKTEGALSEALKNPKYFEAIEREHLIERKMKEEHEKPSRDPRVQDANLKERLREKALIENMIMKQSYPNSK